MPQYKVTFDFAEGLNGWSESYFRQAGTPEAAVEFDAAFWRGFFAIRGNEPVVYRMRVSDTAVPRSGEMFNVLKSWSSTQTNLTSAQPQNDAPSLAMEIKIRDMLGMTTYRLFRGIYDTRYITRGGAFAPSANYVTDAVAFVRALGRAGLQVRHQVAPALGDRRRIVSLGPGPDPFHQTAITYAVAPPWPVGATIRFGRLSRSYFPGLRNGAQVIERPGALIDIVASRWTGPISVTPGNLAYAFQVGWVYSVMARGELIDLRSHRTGRPPALHRGRSSGVRYR